MQTSRFLPRGGAQRGAPRQSPPVRAGPCTQLRYPWPASERPQYVTVIGALWPHFSLCPSPHCSLLPENTGPPPWGAEWPPRRTTSGSPRLGVGGQRSDGYTSLWSEDGMTLRGLPESPVRPSSAAHSSSRTPVIGSFIWGPTSPSLAVFFWDPLQTHHGHLHPCRRVCDLRGRPQMKTGTLNVLSKSFVLPCAFTRATSVSLSPCVAGCFPAASCVSFCHPLCEVTSTDLVLGKREGTLGSLNDTPRVSQRQSRGLRAGLSGWRGSC